MLMTISISILNWSVLAVVSHFQRPLPSPHESIICSRFYINFNNTPISYCSGNQHPIQFADVDSDHPHCRHPGLHVLR